MLSGVVGLGRPQQNGHSVFFGRDALNTFLPICFHKELFSECLCALFSLQHEELKHPIVSCLGWVNFSNSGGLAEKGDTVLYTAPPSCLTQERHIPGYLALLG